MSGTQACQATDHTSLDRGGARAGLQGEARGWWGGLTARVEGHIPQHIGPCSHLCPLLLRTWRQKQRPVIGHCLQCPCLHCGPRTRPLRAPRPSHTSPPLTDVAWTSHPGCGAVRTKDAVTGLASVPLASNPARVQVPIQWTGQRAFSAHSIGLSEPAAVGSQLHCPAQPLKLCDCSSQEWLLQTVINKHVPN